jgi:Skp family chaperone for outer membrane proteins
MFFYRRIALLLTLSIIAATAALAQSSSSNSNPAATGQAQAEQPTEQSHGKLNVPARIKAHRAQRRATAAQAHRSSSSSKRATAAQAHSSSSSSHPAAAGQTQAEQPAAQSQGESQGQMSVQARIKARRAQRRAAAIHDAYSHRYEEYTGMGYLRFEPGAKLQRAHDYAWNVGFTRYFDERLGLTIDGRGYYATAYTGINFLGGTNPFTNPAISQYAALAGPTYRFYVQPKYSISGRFLGGFTKGNFSGDVNHNEADALALGLWPDGYVFAASASIPVEYNLSPNIGLRVAPEYYFTGFGSTIQSSRGFTTGIVYRFGKQ